MSWPFETTHHDPHFPCSDSFLAHECDFPSAENAVPPLLTGKLFLVPDEVLSKGSQRSWPLLLSMHNADLQVIVDMSVPFD